MICRSARTCRIATTAAAIVLMAVAAAAPATAARADGPSRAILSRIDPATALELIEEAGFRGSVVETGERQVDIDAQMAGTTVTVTLLGCTDGRQCSSIQIRYAAGLPHYGLTRDREGLAAAMVATNRWGHGRRYSVAYVHYSRNAGQHVVALATDHPLFGGTTREAIVSTISHFGKQLAEFPGFIRDRANHEMPDR